MNRLDVLSEVESYLTFPPSAARVCECPFFLVRVKSTTGNFIVQLETILHAVTEYLNIFCVDDFISLLL